MAGGGAAGTGGPGTGGPGTGGTTGTGGVVGLDASPDLRPDAGSQAKDAPPGDAAARQIWDRADTSGTPDTSIGLGDGGVPDAPADVALPAPDASCGRTCA